MTSSRHLATLLDDAVVPLAVAVAAAAATTLVVPPHWNAPGLPFFLGVAKNVEGAATAAGLVAAIAATLLGARRPPVLAAAAIGCVMVVARGHLRAILAAWLPGAIAVAATVLLDAGRTPRGPATTERVPPLTAGLAVGGLALVAFVLGSEPLSIDVFHHGEVLASALDLLQGGVPFKSFIWPHGAHDSGLAAGWLALLGKIGTSPVALARATCRALGVVAGYVLARQTIAGRTPALGVAAVLAVLPGRGPLPGAAECPDALYQLGVLAFVIFAFAAMRTRSLSGAVAAGGFLACGYVFRIETALYGAVALAAAAASRAFDDARADGRARGAATRLAGTGVALALGAVLALATSRALLGWPDGAWLDYTLRELPRYHRDAVGLPFPWPLRGEPFSAALPHRSAALGWLVFVVLLCVRATRAVVRRDRDHDILVFLAVFAALATRSALDRSDAAHFLQWAALPLVGVALLVAERLGRAGSPPWLRPALLVAALLWIDGPILRGLPLLPPPSTVTAALAERTRAAREHLGRNAPAGECGDTTMTAGELARPENARFVADVCAVERLLRARGTTGLVIAHSAPWYHVRFGLPLPSRFFAFARAYTPASQAALVDDLRSARPTALLRARGYHALDTFDVPDPIRVPVVDAYLHARSGDVPPERTPLGDLYFWNAPAMPPPPAGAEGDESLRVVAEEAVDFPDAGERLVSGWAVDLAARAPLRALAPTTGDGTERVESGLPRPDVAATLGLPADAARVGWRVTTRLDDPRPATIVAVRSDGARVTVAPKPMRERVLASLAGDAWHGLAATIERARSLGAADRQAAATR